MNYNSFGPMHWGPRPPRPCPPRPPCPPPRPPFPPQPCPPKPCPPRPCRPSCQVPVVNICCCGQNSATGNTGRVSGSMDYYDDGCVNCTDNKGTRKFKRVNRDPFWPHFAKPRWLSCEQLYNQNNA